MATNSHTIGETVTKMATETTARLQEIPASTGNATTVVKGFTGLMVLGQIKENRKTMMSTNYL